MFQLKGLDVSKHNGVIDWKKVDLAGYDFTLIRARRASFTIRESRVLLP